MGSVISKTSDKHGVYRFLKNVHESSFDPSEWEYNPDTSNVTGVEERFWKYNGTNIVVEMSPTEKNIVDISRNVTISEYDSIEFGQRGRCVNKWLRPGGAMFLPSNRQPLVVFNDGVIVGMTYSNLIDNTDVDLCIYKNGINVYTWEVRDKRYAWKNDDLAKNVQFVTGDQISVFARKVGNSAPQWVIVNLQYRYALQITGEGGSATL